MSFIKRTFRHFAAWLLAFSLFAAAGLAALTMTVLNPAYIKTTLAKSGAYDTFVESSLNLATFNQQGNDALDSQTIKTITPVVKASVTPVFLQTTTEAVVDGVYSWLRGSVPYPNYNIPLAQVKESLVSGVAGYIANRLNGLPPCPRGATYAAVDPLTTTCKPPVAISDQALRQNAAEFVESIPAFKNSSIAMSEAEGMRQFTGDKPLAKAPLLYSIVTKAMFVFGALIFACAIAVFIFSKQHFRAWRTIGHTFVSSGVLLVFAAIVTYIFLGRFGQQFFGSASQQQIDFVNTVFTPITQLLSKSLADYSLGFGLVYAVLGAGCYTASHFATLRHKRELADSAENEAQTTETPPTTTG